MLESEIAHLTPEEKLALIGRLWASLEADNLPIPAEVTAELASRWTEHLSNPSAALTLDELMARVAAGRR